MPESITTDKNNNMCANAYLLFSNGKKIKLKGYGRPGIFCGFLTFINGDFTLEELRYNGSFERTKQILCYDNVDILVGEEKKEKNNNEEKNLIVLTSFLPNDIDFDDERLKNITIITGFDKQIIESIFECKNYIDKQNIKCCIVFDNKIDEKDIRNYTKELEKLPEFQSNYNYLSKLKNKKPYKIEKKQESFDDKNIVKLPIAQSKKTIGLYDFGISPILLDILKSYWNIVVLPYDNTAKRTDFLKIDGVIISNSLTDTKFVKENIKNEILKLINNDIPVLGIGFGGILMFEVLNFSTFYKNNELILNSYQLLNNKKIKFDASLTYLKQFDDIKNTTDIDKLFYDINGCCGVKYKNNLMFNFDLSDNNIYTAKILNIFDDLMHNNPRKYNWN